MPRLKYRNVILELAIDTSENEVQRKRNELNDLFSPQTSLEGSKGIAFSDILMDPNDEGGISLATHGKIYWLRQNLIERVVANGEVVWKKESNKLYLPY